MTPRATSTTAENNRRQLETAHPNAPQPVQRSSTPASISPPAGAKRKRLQDSEHEAEAGELEDGRPCKQPREHPSPELSEENLPKTLKLKPTGKNSLPPNTSSLNGTCEYSTGWTPIILGLSSKRTSSRRSTVAPSDADSFRSQRSSNTTAHYRYKHLEGANLYIHVDPPEDIQAAIDEIDHAKSSVDRCAILRDRAKLFWKKCKKMVRAAAGEDDFVHVFYTIAEDMSPKT